MGLILDTSHFSQSIKGELGILSSGKRIAENKDLSRVFGKFLAMIYVVPKTNLLLPKDRS